MTFTSFFVVKIFLYHQIKNYWVAGQGFSRFFLLSMYNDIMFSILKKTNKKKLCILGVFYFHMGTCIIKRIMGAFQYFHVFFWIFLIRKSSSACTRASKWVESIVLKPGSGLRKNRERKNQGWPGDPVDPTRPSQKLSCNPLTFVFLLKQYCFDF